MTLTRSARAPLGGMAVVFLSSLLSLTLITPLKATQRMVIGEEFTNTA